MRQFLDPQTCEQGSITKYIFILYDFFIFHLKVSRQGIVSMSPGPFAPPLLQCYYNHHLSFNLNRDHNDLSRPSLKMTALSYSCTICLGL